MFIHEFFQECELRYQRIKMKVPSIRRGQIMFNYLNDCHPSMAEQIRATPRDPFFLDDREDNPLVWDNFINFIHQNWPIEEK